MCVMSSPVSARCPKLNTSSFALRKKKHAEHKFSIFGKFQSSIFKKKRKARRLTTTKPFLKEKRESCVQSALLFGAAHVHE